MKSEELSWIDKRRDVEPLRSNESWKEKTQEPIPTYEEYLVLLGCTQDQIDQFWFTQGVRDIYKVHGRMADIERYITEINDAKMLGPEAVERVSNLHYQYLSDLKWLVEIEEEGLYRDVFSGRIDVRNMSLEEFSKISQIDHDRDYLSIMLKLEYNTKMLALNRKIAEYLKILESYWTSVK